MHESGGTTTENPKTPLTRDQKKAILITILFFIFTVGNIVWLIVNLNTSCNNLKAKESIKNVQLQADYAENCQIIGDYIPGLAPPLVRYQDENGQEYLYYCTRIEAGNPELISTWKDKRWSIRKDKTDYSIEKYDLPDDYNEILGQTLYHTYEDKYGDKYLPELETYRIYQLNDNYYSEIEASYSRVPTDVNINDPDAIADFLASKHSPTATIYGITLLQPSPDQVDTISHDAPNSIPNKPAKAETCCGCTGCCCENCTCTG